MPQYRLPRPARLLCGALTLLALAACSDPVGGPRSEPARAAESSAADSPSPSPSPSPNPSPRATASASPTVTPTVTPAGTPSADSSATTAPARRTLPDRLLVAEEVPATDGSGRWRTTDTRRREGRRPFGTCQEYAMTTIGAMRAVVRGFAAARETDEAPSSTDPTAGHLVAEFADRETARRAFEVLKSWRSDCREELAGYGHSEIGPFRPVAAGDAEAGWYLLRYGPADGGPEDHLDAQGLVLVGKRVAALEIHVVGSSYDHPPGHEPMVAALRVAAGRLG